MDRSSNSSKNGCAWVIAIGGMVLLCTILVGSLLEYQSHSRDRMKERARQNVEDVTWEVQHPDWEAEKRHR